MATAARTRDRVPATAPLDLERVRADFPILSRKVAGKRLVYLDSAATTQKPRPVLDAERDYYEAHNANVHRGIHRLSVEATDVYEAARAKATTLLGASDPREAIFVRGTTEAINLVAQSYARPRLGPGDEVLVTWMEHHSNIVPWQLVCGQTGATLRAAPIDDRGALLLDELESLVTDRTKVVAVSHISNALGTVNPVDRIAAIAHARGAVIVVDGAQAAAHLPVDVAAMDVDFYAFSGHKTFAPTGIGVLWGRGSLLAEMPPWMGGGDMIRSVSIEGTTYADYPTRFEAGTPNVGGAVGLGAAIDWLRGVGIERIMAHEEDLLEYGTELLSGIEGLRIIGTAPGKVGVISFVMSGVHPHDIGTILDREGVAVRTGHHCAQPVMERFGVPATVRASLSVYNGRDDLDALAAGLREVRSFFG
jgi:cysteine desulfurase/selenocysteine lyase